MPHTNTTARRLGAAVFAFAAATAVGVSATSLGGVDGNEVGAESGLVGSCDTNGVDVEYRAPYHARSGEYRINRVILRNVSEACADLPYRLTLFGSDGTRREVSGDRLPVRNIRNRAPRPAVDRAGVVRLRIIFPAEQVDGFALVVVGEGD